MGDVGEYEGDVGEIPACPYAGEVGEYPGDVGVNAGLTGENRGDVAKPGLLILMPGEVGEYPGDVGENPGEVGLVLKGLLGE